MKSFFSIFFTIVFLGLSSVISRAEMKPGHDTFTPKAKTFKCTPHKILKGDTLTVQMSVPHGGDFSIIDPSGRYFFISFWAGPQGKQKPEIDWEAFKNMSEFKLNTETAKGFLPGGGPKSELIFTKAGSYEILMAGNLEGENDADTLNTCKVVYAPK